MTKKILITTLVIYLLSAIGSYAVFSRLLPQTQLVGGGDQAANDDEQTKLGALLEIDPGAPKDQPCPLNGKMYTQTEREAWEQRRPLAVMIENAPDARPQSGLSSADVVFEAVAEGGVTRFMAMYYCDAQAYDVTIAPVRSARSYFIDWASGYNYPMYVHVGGANIAGPANALGQLGEYGWNLENDVNQFSVGYPTFVRNYNRLGKQVATEHTMETTTEKLWDVAEERDWTNIAPERRLGRTVVGGDDWKDGYEGWTFQDEAPSDGSVTTISHDFWSGYGQYALTWNYDPASKTYKRVMGGEPHIDLNNDEQIAAANVVVLLTQERGPIDELKHMLYTTTGTGNALVFNNGQVTQARWSKADRESELVFTDRSGGNIEFARGLTWISVVDVSTEVEYPQ